MNRKLQEQLQRHGRDVCGFMRLGLLKEHDLTAACLMAMVDDFPILR
jgi:hypothetical protein